MTIPRDPPNPPLGRWGKTWRVAFVVIVGFLAWVTVRSTLPDGISSALRLWAMPGDLLVGIAAGVLTIWRRRWPLRIALIVTLAGAVSASAGGAVILMLASVAARRRWRELAWLVPLNIATGVASERLYPSLDENRLNLILTLIMITLLVAAVTAVGYAVGGRRELERERVESAERDQARRVAQAAAGERTRIAREMHDVLAHRISLVAMHAGALNYRKDLTPDQMSEALMTIETNAHQALADLREVLGVLREPRLESDGAPEPPQPDIRDLPHLIAEAEGLGTRITYADSTVGEVPPVLGRTAYRVVQEALTNARKHAPGTTVRVSVSGASPGGLQIEIRNPRALQPLDHALPRSGLGLLGLRERVALAGGLLRHGTEPDGGYLVSAWLPWPGPDPTQGVSR